MTSPKDSLLQRTRKLARPEPTAEEIIGCIETNDLGSREGKKALWVLITRLGPFLKSEFETLRDKYLGQQLNTRESNRLAALDIAAQLPTAHEVATAEDRRAIEPACAGTHADREAKDGEIVPVYSVHPAPKQLKQTIAGRKHAETQETVLDRLLRRVQENAKGVSCHGLGRYIPWVTANLRTRLERIDADDVPGPEALTTLLWAQQNETAYRQLYDCKRIPAKGIAADEEKGFIDGGEPIEDIISRIKQGIQQLENANDPLRPVQATESGSKHCGRDGHMSDLSEGPDGKRAGADSRRQVESGDDDVAGSVQSAVGDQGPGDTGTGGADGGVGNVGVGGPAPVGDEKETRTTS